jgi:uncharacterized protein YegP (UPF0339 family)
MENTQKNGFEFYLDHRGEWRWRHWSQGRKTGDSAEGYKNRADCVHAARKLGYAGD